MAKRKTSRRPSRKAKPKTKAGAAPATIEAEAAANFEPTWALKGRDMLTPAVILAWAAMAKAAGVNADKVQGAVQDAFSLACWQNANGRKLPD